MGGCKTINMEHPLTKQQQRAFDLVENTRRNFFITGKPGTGKSVLTRALQSDGNKTYTVAAPTGLAALNANGRTLHSLFRLPVSRGIIAPDFNLFTQDQKTRDAIKYGLKGPLIIDEISMVRVDMFDFIDRLLRDCKGVNLPFGGIQVILVGDFYQLPPVVVDEEHRQLKEYGYASPFVFDAHAFKGCFETVVLSEVLRQKGDPKFIKLLDDARVGTVTEKQIETLNKNVCYTMPDMRIRLCGINKQSDEVNATFLAAIDSPVKQYTATKWGEWPALPAEEFLRLKVGAQVMVKQNAADRPPDHEGPFVSKVVNGTLGVVEAMTDNSVTITTDKGEAVTIYQQQWQHKVKTKTGNTWTETVTASFEQVPLALAWAISIHKSQGQSFEKVHIDMSNIFAKGQAYVALSRGRSLAGISFNSKLTQKKFFCDERVTKFFETL